MNRLPSLLIGALIAFAAVSCVDKTKEPAPPIDFNEVFTANTFTTSGIYMATRQGWVQDTAFIRTYLNRLIAQEKGEEFLKKNHTMPLNEQQELSFNNGKAQLSEGGQQNQYSYLLANYNSILWMGQDNIITYFDHKKPEAIENLGKVVRQYYEKTEVDPSTGYHYSARCNQPDYDFSPPDAAVRDKHLPKCHYSASPAKAGKG